MLWLAIPIQYAQSLGFETCTFTHPSPATYYRRDQDCPKEHTFTSISAWRYALISYEKTFPPRRLSADVGSFDTGPLSLANTGKAKDPLNRPPSPVLLRPGSDEQNSKYGWWDRQSPAQLGHTGDTPLTRLILWSDVHPIACNPGRDLQSISFFPLYASADHQSNSTVAAITFRLR